MCDQEVKFRIEILHFDGSNFSVTAENDQMTVGTEGVGKISGRIKNGMVSFAKEMPIQTYYLRDGKKM